MEKGNKYISFTLAPPNHPKSKWNIQEKILQTLPMLNACYNSQYGDNRNFICKLEISPESVKFFFTWKKWVLGDIGKPDFTQIVPKQWTDVAQLAAYFMDDTFFDTDSNYYVLPPLYVMREELPTLVPEARDIYFSEYLTQTHCPQCTCSNVHIVSLNYMMDKYSPKEKKMLEKTYDFLVEKFRRIYWSYSDDLTKEWKEIKNYFEQKNECYSIQEPKNINSRDNQTFVDFMISKEQQTLLDTALSFNETYIENVAQNIIYNFLQLDVDDRIAMFDYFCYHKHFSQYEKSLYKCVCDVSFYRKWNDFITKDPFVAKLIFDTLDRQELLRATGVVKKGGSIKKFETFDELIKYIKSLAPKVNTNNLSGEEKKRLAKEANKKWNQMKYQDPSYLKMHIQPIRVITINK